MRTIHLKFAAFAVALICAMSSCQEHIEEGARFTFVGETIASYLEDNEEFSSFVDILKRGGNCLGLMKAYGEYTCFAPINEAVEQYVMEQYTIYQSSVDSNKVDPGFEIVETGVTSPHPADLSVEKCTEIARNHIIAVKYLGVDFAGNQIPNVNMNDRYLTLDMDTIGGKGVWLINSEAPVVYEEEVENGVVHVISKMVSPSNVGVAGQIDAHNYFSLFSVALDSTHYSTLLTATEDMSYDPGRLNPKKHPDNNSSDQVPYPVNRYMGFTAFIEPDEVFNAYEIYSFTDLVEACKNWYPEGTLVWSPEDEEGNRQQGEVDFDVPYHDWRNPVNQFVGYHLLDRKIPYDYLVCYNIDVPNFKSSEDFPDKEDRIEYYETMNGRILKVTMPRSEYEEDSRVASSIYLNYMNHEEIGQGQNILVYAPNDFKLKEEYKDFNQEALNGSLNVLGDVLIYNGDIMKSCVLNCVMRFDVASLCSEFTNNNIRWKQHNPNSAPGELYIPNRYCDNIEIFTEDTRLYYLSPHHKWHNYQGDEVQALGQFDLAYKLPPIPSGTYEVRLGYSASTERHLVQVYLDNEVTGIPIDLRITGDEPQIGWRPDGKDYKMTNSKGVEITIPGLLDDKEAIAALDKDMKNRGYLKGPSSFYDDEKDLARDDHRCLRAVIATKLLEEGSHWLRFKNVLDGDDGNAEFMHDYFEIVPVQFLRAENIDEEYKRK